MTRSSAPYVLVGTAGPQAQSETGPFEGLTARATDEAPEEVESRNGHAEPLVEPGPAFTPLHSEMTALSLSPYEVREELAPTKNRAEILERQQRAHVRRRERDVAHAASTELGLFILGKVAQRDEGILIDEVAMNLEGPDGWLAIGRLMRADLLDENGRVFYVTAAGEEVLEDIQGSLEEQN